MSMHAASRSLWRALSACSKEGAAGSVELQQALTNYLLNYAWGAPDDGLIGKYKKLLFALARRDASSIRVLVSELAPEAIREIEAYNRACGAASGEATRAKAAELGVEPPDDIEIAGGKA